jgi:periplasmic divalent cation tolerance protein
MTSDDVSSPTPCIGWTTFEKKSDAEHCAEQLVAAGLAFCVQVEPPVRSYYQWEGNLDSGEEHPVRIKHMDCNGPAIQRWLRENHPYDTPQWIAVKACDSLEEYFHWALQNSKPRSEKTE